jgi:hypothetical protein
VERRDVAEAQRGDAVQFALALRGTIRLVYWQTEDQQIQLA